MVCRVPEKLLQRSRSDFLRRHQDIIVLDFVFWSFIFVSNFVLRISSFSLFIYLCISVVPFFFFFH